jgi:putative transposase
MQLVEQHIISKGDPRFHGIDEMAFASKNLWNLANYYVRQSFMFEHIYLNSAAVYHLVKSSVAYQALPRKVSNQVLIQLDQAWTAFFEEMEAYRERPERFTGRPKLPKYKHKTVGRNLLVFELGAIWKAHLAQREIAVSQLGRLVETKQHPKQIQQVRLVPEADQYVVEVIYQAEVKKAKVDQDLFVALDPGVSVLAALTSNKPGFSPRLVPGGPLKATNQLYNKQREHEQKRLAKGKEQHLISHREDSHYDEAHSPDHALSAYGQPSHY